MLRHTLNSEPKELPRRYRHNKGMRQIVNFRVQATFLDILFKGNTNERTESIISLLPHIVQTGFLRIIGVHQKNLGT